MWSFSFVVNEMHELVEATAVLGGLPKEFDLKSSPEMFSIIARLSRSSAFILSLQMFSPFFNQYVCSQILPHYSSINIESFYPILFQMKTAGFRSLSFSLPLPNHALLTFQAPNRPPQEVALQMTPSNSLKDANEFDFIPFVSINSQDFINIVTSFTNIDYLSVTVTNSQVIFAYKRVVLVLTPQRKQCIIGGVLDQNVSFITTLLPTVVFCDLATQSKRVWLFRSTNSPNKGVISAPIGLHARFLSYFPERVLL